MAGSTTKVDKAALGKEDDVAAVVHEVAVDLGLDVLDRFRIGFQPGYVDLNVKVSNI